MLNQHGEHLLYQVGPNGKNLPIIKFKNIVKLIDLTCDSLTNFEYKGHVIAGNGHYVNLLKLVWKKL